MTVRKPDLLLARDFPPLGGGIARMLGEIARHSPPGALLVSTGRVGNPTVGAGVDGLEDGVDRVNVDVDRLRTLPGLIRWTRRAGRLARQAEVGFVWAGNLRPAGHVARWVARGRRIPYGLVVYGLDVERLAAKAERSALARLAARATLDGAAGTVAISHSTAGRFTAMARALGCGAAADRVRVICPGVDARRFRPGVDTAAVRRRYGLDERPWLLTVARLMPHKGIDTAIEVLARLRAEGRDVGYLVAGTGPAEQGLRRQAVEQGVADRVRWLGHVPDEDLPALYAAATLYLGLSREEGPEVEGFGLALLEAQAAGLPVVAGRGGGTADAVADGVSGILVDPRDVVAAAALAGGLLADRGRALAMGAAGRARAGQAFTWERVVADLADAAREFSVSRGGPAGR